MKNARNYAFNLIDNNIVSEHDLLIAFLTHMTDNNIETILRISGLLVEEDFEEID
jgi:hypothetical protein